MENDKETKMNNNNSTWWHPNTIEYVMLTVAVLTLMISILTQINALLENTIKIGEIYTQLYPVLNVFHLFVILYAMYQMQNIKKLLPDTSTKTTDCEYIKKAKKLVIDLKEKWIPNYIGSFYFPENNEKEVNKESNFKEQNIYVDWTVSIPSNEKEVDEDFVKGLITDTNKDINKLYKYWGLVWVWLFVLYVFEFIKSTSNSICYDVLQSLVIAFNNLLSVYWFLIYLKLDQPIEKEKLTQNNKDEVLGKKWTKKKRKYVLNKCAYKVIHSFNFSKPFNKADKYDEYENYDEAEKKKKEKYKDIKIHLYSWKIIAWLIFTVLFLLLLAYNLGKIDNDWCKHFRVINDHWYEGAMYISVLLGASSMLAAFSKLGSGFFRIPLSALLVMLFYSAVQPLFFANQDLLNDELKSGQLLFIINFICLIGKFALLYIIKWIFSDYRIAYYFINERIINDNDKKISDDELKKLFEKQN